MTLECKLDAYIAELEGRLSSQPEMDTLRKDYLSGEIEVLQVVRELMGYVSNVEVTLGHSIDAFSKRIYNAPGNSEFDWGMLAGLLDAQRIVREHNRESGKTKP